MTIDPDERGESWLRGWREGRLAGLEAAAKKAQERIDFGWKLEEQGNPQHITGEIISAEAGVMLAAIRALMEKPDA